ncbi:MAG: S9 family peptidase [Acidimicrobiales bacterium]
MVKPIGTSEDSPFDLPATFMTIPRLGALALSPTGDRLIASVAELDDKGAKFVTSLWVLDPEGHSTARRLTRSSEGEGAPAFLPDGSLLFTSARPRPAASGTPGDKGEADLAAVWLLPVEGGEAVLVADRPGGVLTVVTGRDTDTVVVAAKSAPGTASAEEDREWWAARRAQKVGAVLYESLPVRHWDHHLGPDEVHLYAGTIDSSVPGETILRDLTPDAGQALHDSHPVLSPDGSTLLVDWMVSLERGRSRRDIVAIDIATGSRRTVAADEEGSAEYEHPAISPDGRLAVALRTSRATPTEPSEVDLWLIDLADGTGRALSVGDEPYAHGASFTADSAALIVTADWRGHAPLLLVEVASGDVTRMTPGGAWSSPQVGPDGETLYALCSAIDKPPRAVRIPLGPAAPGQAVAVAGDAITVLDAPGGIERLPGHLEEVTAVASDGARLRGWLVLPEGATAEEPAPLLLWVHGGPLGSWNSWHWRWNPWLMSARGWAVLLPDPALSTGYGMDMVRRGWGEWGGAPFDDLMTITDAALLRPELDAARTAAMGGSYGGYMANWIAGHTERFAAIVSHASLWSLEQFQATTDWPAYWADEWGYPDTNPELYEHWSPDRSVDAIRTPMLITHGDRDYRCPIGESLRLWTELTRRGVKARFLWFAGENHWILQPGDAVVWYETVLAFLEEHVLGGSWERPAMV